MKKNFKILLTATLSIFFITGCAQIQPEPTLKKEYIPEIKIKKEDIDPVKQQLAEIAKEQQIKWNEYTEILTQLKRNTKLYTNSVIPKNLSKRASMSFDGPYLMLVEDIAKKSGYTFRIEDISVGDSKIISRKYKDTMYMDIIRELTDKENIVVNIDDKKMEFFIYLK